MRNNNITNEEWRPIKGHPHYYISNIGNVYTGKAHKVMVQDTTRQGYKQIGLRTNGKRFNFLVHRLVAQAFIPNPQNLETVNHKNGIKDDNRVENLEWMSQHDNNMHSLKNKLVKRKLTPKQRLEIYELCRSKKLSQYKIAKMYNISQSWVSAIGSKKPLSY